MATHLPPNGQFGLNAHVPRPTVLARLLKYDGVVADAVVQTVPPEEARVSDEPYSVPDLLPA